MFDPEKGMVARMSELRALASSSARVWAIVISVTLAPVSSALTAYFIKHVTTPPASSEDVKAVRQLMERLIDALPKEKETTK